MILIVLVGDLTLELIKAINGARKSSQIVFWTFLIFEGKESKRSKLRITWWYVLSQLYYENFLSQREEANFSKPVNLCSNNTHGLNVQVYKISWRGIVQRTQTCLVCRINCNGKNWRGCVWEILCSLGEEGAVERIFDNLSCRRPPFFYQDQHDKKLFRKLKEIFCFL